MNDSPKPTLSHLKHASLITQSLAQEISKSVIGQHQVIDEILIAMLAGGHVLIEGVPGLGKTLIVQALAKTFGGSFSRIQFTPDLMPSDVTGHMIYDLKNESFNLHKGPIFTHMLLADEINRAPAKTQSALLEVMQEQQVTIEGKRIPVPQPFMTLATQNPLEQEGTYPLPEAQLDRFLFKILIEYPHQKDEEKMVSAMTTGRVGDSLSVEQIKRLINPESVSKLRQVAANIQVDPAVIQYAVNIVRTTREWPGIMIGAGPRGGLAIIRAAKAAALLAGKEFVTPDDIKKIAPAALRHRVTLAPELEIEGQSIENILSQLLDSVAAPRQ